MRTVFGIAIRYTLVTAVLLGLVYPLAITAIAQLTMPAKANGQLITRNGVIVGSASIGQGFATDAYFHSRPSAAGNGYDAANSGGSNLAQSNQALLDRINASVVTYQKQNPGIAVPIELVTTSASGIDPQISPAAAYYQVHTVATARHMSEDAVRQVVDSHVQGRTLGLLGEARVNVLQLNMALDDVAPPTPHAAK